MPEVRSTKYPNLFVRDLGVKFVDGVATVSDTKVLAALATLDGVEVPPTPRRTRKRSDDTKE